jgi:hypothetical protein
MSKGKKKWKFTGGVLHEGGSLNGWKPPTGNKFRLRILYNLTFYVYFPRGCRDIAHERFLLK